MRVPLKKDDGAQQELVATAHDDQWPVPKLRLHVNDLSSEGSALFFAHLHPLKTLRDAVLSVMKTLYTPQTVPKQ